MLLCVEIPIDTSGIGDATLDEMIEGESGIVRVGKGERLSGAVH